MKRVAIKKTEVLDFVEETITDTFLAFSDVKDYRFHHNAKYEDAVSILENGILSATEQKKLGIISEGILGLYDDTESHINGTESISLAVLGLTDLNPNELEYDPFSTKYIDFLISNGLTVRRASKNYGNEFLTDHSISSDKIRAIDIRIISYIASIKVERDKRLRNVSINQLLINYHRLKEIAMVLKQRRMDIPIREMSLEEGKTLDVLKVAEMPVLKIKRF